MDLERRRPALYGQKALSVTVNTTNVDQTVIVSASDLLETVAAKIHAAVRSEEIIDENPSLEHKDE